MDASGRPPVREWRCVMPEIRERDGDCLLPVRVTPRASKTEILDVVGGRLRIRLQAPPVEGAANKALEEFLAKVFSVPKSSVSVERGGTGREKMLRIAGLSEEAARRKLAETGS